MGGAICEGVPWYPPEVGGGRIGEYPDADDAGGGIPRVSIVLGGGAGGIIPLPRNGA